MLIDLSTACNYPSTQPAGDYRVRFKGQKLSGGAWGDCWYQVDANGKSYGYLYNTSEGDNAHYHTDPIYNHPTCGAGTYRLESDGHTLFGDGWLGGVVHSGTKAL